MTARVSESKTAVTKFYALNSASPVWRLQNGLEFPNVLIAKLPWKVQ